MRYWGILEIKARLIVMRSQPMFNLKNTFDRAIQTSQIFERFATLSKKSKPNMGLIFLQVIPSTLGPN